MQIESSNLHLKLVDKKPMITLVPMQQSCFYSWHCLGFHTFPTWYVHSPVYITHSAPFNPLTTDDAIWRRLTLATCYQLAQSICASKKGGIGRGSRDNAKGEVSGFQHGVPCTWQLPWLAIEKPWSALTGPFFTLLAQKGSGTPLLPL